MANRQTTFLLKRSNVPGKIPSSSGLTLGELALNTADAILYTSGTTANNILPIGWDRIHRTGDTVTGDFNFFGDITISGSSLPNGYALSVTGDTDFKSDVYVEGNLTVSGNSGVNWFSGNTSTDLLRVTQTGSGDAFVVEDESNPDSTPFVIDASGNTAIGVTTSPLSFKLEVNGTSMFRNNMTLNQGTLSEDYTYLTSTDSNKRNLTVSRFHDHNDGPVDFGYTSQFRWDKRQSSNISLARSIDIPVNFTSGSSGAVGQFNSINTNLQIVEGSTITTPFTAHFIEATKGTTGTVTSFTGIDVNDNSVSNTIYGFRSRLTLGTGKYGLYFDGTANNYLNGNVGIGTSTPTATLQVSGTTLLQSISGTSLDISGNSSSDLVKITQTGSGNAFVVEDSIRPDSSPFVIDASGNVGIGTSTPQARLDVRAQGNLSTDVAFRVRNSGNTIDYLVVNGAGDVYNNGAQGVVSNTFYGENVGRNNTGTFNTFIGYLAGSTSGTTSDSTFIGYNTGRSHTSGIRNTYVGSEAGAANTNGSQNTFIGRGAGGSIIGSSNTSVGGQSFAFVTTGSNNVTLGSEAGLRISAGTNTITSNNSIFIGFDTRANADSQTNQIVIGHTTIGLGSNTTVIGNTGTTLFRPHGNVAIGADTAGARLDVRAQSNLSTDIAFRVRNSGDTKNLFSIGDNGRIEMAHPSFSGTNSIFISANNQVTFSTDVIGDYMRVGPGNVVDFSNQEIKTNGSAVLGTIRTGVPYILNLNEIQSGVTSGNTTFRGILTNPTINFTGTYSGDFVGYDYQPTVTSIANGRHIAMRVASGDVLFNTISGNTGIGTTTPREKLDVSGNTIVSGTISGGTMVITTQPTSGYTTTQILMRNSTSGQVEITDSTSPSIYNYGMSYAMSTFNYLT